MTVAAGPIPPGARGCKGLHDRLTVVDGVLSIDSPRGGGTVARAHPRPRLTARAGAIADPAGRSGPGGRRPPRRGRALAAAGRPRPTEDGQLCCTVNGPSLCLDLGYDLAQLGVDVRGSLLAVSLSARSARPHRSAPRSSRRTTRGGAQRGGSSGTDRSRSSTRRRRFTRPPRRGGRSCSGCGACASPARCSARLSSHPRQARCSRAAGLPAVSRAVAHPRRRAQGNGAPGAVDFYSTQHHDIGPLPRAPSASSLGRSPSTTTRARTAT